MIPTQQENSTNDTLPPTLPQRNVVELSFLAQIVKQVGQVEDEVIQELPALPDDASDAQEALRRAQVAHFALLRLGHKEKIASAARRWQLWMVYDRELWRNVRIPLTEPDGSPTGNVYTFESFDDYFAYVAEEWGVRAPSSISILKNGATVLLPAANSGLITSDNGKVYTVEDILTLDEHIQQLLIGVANRALNPPKGQEPQPVETIGQAADIIMSTGGDYDESVVRLKEARLIGGKAPEYSKFTIFTYDAGDEIYIAGKLTPTQYRTLLMALKSKAEPASSSLEALANLFGDNGDQNDTEDYGAALAQQLTRSAR